MSGPTQSARARIREVLLHKWDPIGVSNVPKASNEYDAYLDKIYVMLMDDRADAVVVEAYLWEIATISMGIPAGDLLSERCSATASHLVGLRPQFETHEEKS